MRSRFLIALLALPGLILACGLPSFFTAANETTETETTEVVSDVPPPIVPPTVQPRFPETYVQGCHFSPQVEWAVVQPGQTQRLYDWRISVDRGSTKVGIQILNESGVWVEQSTKGIGPFTVEAQKGWLRLGTVTLFCLRRNADASMSVALWTTIIVPPTKEPPPKK